jgi:small subunit ribosomal protein S17
MTGDTENGGGTGMDKAEKKAGVKKVRTGVVVSDAMNKSVVAKVERVMRHPLYHKTVKKTKKYMVHDEKNESKAGDLIRFVEVRPLSKNKCWKLLEVVQKAK